MILVLAASASCVAERLAGQLPTKFVGRYQWNTADTMPYSVTLDVARIQQTDSDVIEFWGKHTYVPDPVGPLIDVDRHSILSRTYVMQVKGTIDCSSQRITLTESEPSHPDGVTAGEFVGTVSDDLAVIEATWTTEGTGEQGVLSLCLDE